MPLLYVNDLAAARIWRWIPRSTSASDAIDRLLARQGSNGSFGLWSAGGDDAWLDAYVTDFLTRAREKGFAVPDVLFKLALDRIRNSSSTPTSRKRTAAAISPTALYVLARNGAAPIGDLRYLADTKLDNLATPIAKAQLAAALGWSATARRAERVYARRRSKPRAKSRCSSSAGSTTARRCAMPRRWFRWASAKAARRGRPSRRRSQRVERRGADALHLDAGECLAGAGRARAREGNAGARCRRRDRQGRALPQLQGGEMAGKPVKITNTGEAPVQAVVSVSARRSRRSPRRPTASRSSALLHARRQAGRSVQGQAERPLRGGAEDHRAASRNSATSWCRLSAGRLRDRQSAAGLVGRHRHADWIEDGEEPENTEFRDDRFTAAFDRASDDKAVFTVAYVVRAVSPGQIRAAAGLCRGHVQPLALRPHRHRVGRGARRNERDASSLPCPGSPSGEAGDPGIHAIDPPPRRRGWPGQARG
jgi:uncharacterized protein YfaS (alpha-2-macroglobulin family)